MYFTNFYFRLRNSAFPDVAARALNDEGSSLIHPAMNAIIH
jgi:hypothetical protein